MPQVMLFLWKCFHGAWYVKCSSKVSFVSSFVYMERSFCMMLLNPVNERDRTVLVMIQFLFIFCFCSLNLVTFFLLI